MRRKILICLMCSLLVFSFTGCDTKFSMFNIVFGSGSDEMVTKMTVYEYELKVDRLLNTLFSDCETILANSKYVTDGTRDIDEEYTVVEAAIKETQNVIDQIDKLAEPDKKTEDKANLLVALTNYKSSLTNYAIALNSKDNEKIKDGASDVMANMETLKSHWQSYTE